MGSGRGDVIESPPSDRLKAFPLPSKLCAMFEFTKRTKIRLEIVGVIFIISVSIAI